MHNVTAISIRGFIGAKDFAVSRSFYHDLGFGEKRISDTFSVFTLNSLSFYLQDYYVKDWIENSMLLLEVDSVAQYWTFLQGLELEKKYASIKLVPIQHNDWGSECMLIDPAGVLWHFAEFRKG